MNYKPLQMINGTPFIIPSRTIPKCSKPPSTSFINSKRGKISKFSSQSNKRLRESLAYYYMPNSYCIAVSATISAHDNITCEEYQNFFHYFQIYQRKNNVLKNCAFIWRHELQAHGLRKPHTHFLAFCPKEIPIKDFYFAFVDLWQHLQIVCNIADGYIRYCHGFGVNMKVCDNVEKYYRYLAEHMTKKKHDQLGFVGRQWGIQNRKLLQKRSISDLFDQCRIMSVQITPQDKMRLEIRVERYLRRSLRYRKQGASTPYKQGIFAFYKTKVLKRLPNILFLNDTQISDLKKVYLFELQNITKFAFPKKINFKQSLFPFMESA